jgi:TonB family protein
VNVSGLLSTGVSVLGWCLLHFVWQAAAVGTVYALVRGLLPRGNPRYLAAMLAMFAMAACPVATAWHESRLEALPQQLHGAMVSARTIPAAVSAATASPDNWRALLDAALPWLVVAWALGVVVLGLRVVRQWLGLRALLRAAESLPLWQARAREFAGRLGLRRIVPVLASVRVATPTLVGWVRPAVVLPLALLARMPAAQIDLVLAHELAHLKRLDHLANLFQVVLETLFFYHPAVHWISREARNERELCCDALALRITGGERRDFVEALASLEEFRAGHGDLALAASGGVLVERAWFIAGATAGRGSGRRHPRAHAAMALAAAVLLGIGWFAWREVAWQRQVATLVAANNASLLGDMGQDVRPPLALVPGTGSGSSQGLLSAPYAKLLPSVAVPGPAMPIHVTTIGKPALKLADPLPRLSPIIAAVVDAQAMHPAPGMPVAVHTVRPVYPSTALLVGLQGQVVVEFSLDKAGVPQHPKIVTSSASQFDAAALQAMATWRFAPPAPAATGRRYRQTFSFQLGAGSASGAGVARSCLVTTGTHICRNVY